MNKLLVAIFENQTAADAGLKALRALHVAGDITLYASGVVARNADGAVRVEKSMDAGGIGAGTGLAVGSLIGLLGGPVGVLVGAATGTVVGTVRDFWVAGVGLDFIEEATRHLRPGKVALVAEIEEEWVTPLDVAVTAAGGRVFRRSRSEMAAEHYDHDVAALESEIEQLESEASSATDAARMKLQAELAIAKTRLEGAVQRARQHVDALKQEADAKAKSLELQVSQVTGDVRARVDARAKRVRTAYHTRGAKLSQAWNLAKEALTA